METIAPSHVVAERQLHLRGEDPALAQVRVLLGRPSHRADFDDYRCQLQIVGLGDEKIRSAFGVDPLQALQLAQVLVGAQLYSSREYEQGRLYWLEAGNRDLGFPPPGDDRTALIEITLNSGRGIWGEQLFVQQTYTNFSVRSPGKGNDFVLDCISGISKHTFHDTPCLTLDPGPGSPDLPRLTIFCQFTSLPLDPDLHVSDLVIVWLQNELEPLVSPAIMEKLQAVDWDAHAKDGDT